MTYKDLLLLLALSGVLIAGGYLFFLAPEWTTDKTRAFEQFEAGWKEQVDKRDLELIKQANHIGQLQIELGDLRRLQQATLEAYFQSRKNERWWMEKSFRLEEELRERQNRASRVSDSCVEGWRLPNGGCVSVTNQ